jgi:hypothetical protein
VEIIDGAIIKCNYELCVKVANKSNVQSETPSRVIQTRESIFSKTASRIENSLLSSFNSETGEPGYVILFTKQNMLTDFQYAAVLYEVISE